MKQVKTMSVVMLPTEKALKRGGIVKLVKLFDGSIPSEQRLETIKQDEISPNNKFWQGYCLYLVSDAEIKEGDWIMRDFDNTILKDNINSDNRKGEKFWKIEATTDSSLEIITKNYDYLGNDLHELLPQIPQSFIEAYVKAEGKITEVDVEMIDNGREELGEHDEIMWVEKLEIKTRPDNTVIIHQSKTYTREEVQRFINSFADAHNIPVTDKVTKKWIKENL